MEVIETNTEIGPEAKTITMYNGESLKEIATFVSNKLSTLDNVLSTGTHFILKKYKDMNYLKKKSVTKNMMITQVLKKIIYLK